MCGFGVAAMEIVAAAVSFAVISHPVNFADMAMELLIFHQVCQLRSYSTWQLFHKDTMAKRSLSPNILAS